MTIKPWICLFLPYSNILGPYKTIDEYRQKRRLQWGFVVAFMIIIFIANVLAMIELLRASGIIRDIEDIKELIANLKNKHGDMPEVEKKINTLKEQNLLHKRDLNKQICSRKDFVYRTYERVCVKRIYKLLNQNDSHNYCKEIGGDGLFKLDSIIKLEMFQDFPFDYFDDAYVDKPYWIDGKVNENDIWTFSNGARIPTNLGQNNSLKDPKCFVIFKANNFKFTNEDCENQHLSLCEYISDIDRFNLDEL